jgi:hypothetical protein
MPLRENISTLAAWRGPRNYAESAGGMHKHQHLVDQAAAPRHARVIRHAISDLAKTFAKLGEYHVSRPGYARFVGNVH